MTLKHGRFGEYLKCDSEDCGATRSFEEKTGVTCPKCNKGQIVAKKSKRGKIFYACNQYPACDQAFWNKPINVPCPQCNMLLTEKVLKKGTFQACPDKNCGYIKQVEDDAAAPAAATAES
jgi:DNA topoisomerase-1